MLFLPCKGRWQAEGLTEGYPPYRERDTPPTRCARHLPFQGRNVLDPS